MFIACSERFRANSKELRAFEEMWRLSGSTHLIPLFLKNPAPLRAAIATRDFRATLPTRETKQQMPVNLLTDKDRCFGCLGATAAA